MFNQDSLLEYLSSPEGINKIIVGIILVGAINAIFITYSVRSTYGAIKKEREKLIRILSHDVERIERLITDYSQILKDEVAISREKMNKIIAVQSDGLKKTSQSDA